MGLFLKLVIRGTMSMLPSKRFSYKSKIKDFLALPSEKFHC